MKRQRFFYLLLGSIAVAVLLGALFWPTSKTRADSLDKGDSGAVATESQGPRSVLDSVAAESQRAPGTQPSPAKEPIVGEPGAGVPHGSIAPPPGAAEGNSLKAMFAADVRQLTADQQQYTEGLAAVHAQLSPAEKTELKSRLLDRVDHLKEVGYSAAAANGAVIRIPFREGDADPTVPIGAERLTGMGPLFKTIGRDEVNQEWVVHYLEYATNAEAYQAMWEYLSLMQSAP